MQEALFYKKIENRKTICLLCPQKCIIKPGSIGNCYVRKNLNGTLYSLMYNRIAAKAIDPIEKKPLYHFYPKKKILSIGGVGCNLHCSFCQNSHISQCSPEEYPGLIEITPQEIVNEALTLNENIGIAYTYNEPVTFYEFMIDTAEVAKEFGLKNVMISNGYIMPEPLERLINSIDAFNIDLKAFNEEFYKKEVKGSLAPVLNTLKTIANNNRHLEITSLIIPGLNDDIQQFTEMVKWIADNLGANTPLHISRYFPRYRKMIPPTPPETIFVMMEIAMRYLKNVHPENLN